MNLCRGFERGTFHWGSNTNQSDSIDVLAGCELGCQVVVVVRIGYHRKAPGHVDTGDKEWLDVAVSSLAGERHPRVVMLFRVFFKVSHQFNIFPVSRMLGHQGGALFASVEI